MCVCVCVCGGDGGGVCVVVVGGGGGGGGSGGNGGGGECGVCDCVKPLYNSEHVIVTRTFVMVTVEKCFVIVLAIFVRGPQGTTY